jgi:hypothetical protein
MLTIVDADTDVEYRFTLGVSPGVECGNRALHI